MAIIMPLNKYEFVREFQAIRPDNFSQDGLGFLYDHLNSLSDDMGKDIEFDPVAICCDFEEYDLKEWWYGWNDPVELEGMDEDEAYDHIIECAEKAANDGLIIAHNEDFSVVIVDSNY